MHAYSDCFEANHMKTEIQLRQTKNLHSNTSPLEFRQNNGAIEGWKSCAKQRLSLEHYCPNKVLECKIKKQSHIARVCSSPTCCPAVRNARKVQFRPLPVSGRRDGADAVLWRSRDKPNNRPSRAGRPLTLSLLNVSTSSPLSDVAETADAELPRLPPATYEENVDERTLPPRCG